MIINADDFGLSTAVNAAILESFRRGWCSSTSLMANMPATAEAAQIAHDQRLVDHVGLHLVLDGGPAVTDAIRQFPRFCRPDGQLRFRRRPSTFRLDTAEKSALAAEISAQVDRARSLGIPLTHVDSHHHVHVEWAVLQVLIRVVSEKRIPYVRIARNCGVGTSLLKSAYKTALNLRLRQLGLARTRYFGGIDDLLWKVARTGNPGIADAFEIMVHPMPGTGGEITDLETGPPLGEAVQGLVGYRFLESYSGRRYEASNGPDAG